MTVPKFLAIVSLAAALAAPAHADSPAGRQAIEQGDLELASRELAALALAGDKEAAYRLGDLYRDGQGVAASLAAAAGWYRKAGDMGHPAAQFEYGVALEEGLGVPRSRKEAFDWYLKAAKQGHAGAMTRVGRFHLQGVHRKPNLIEAKRWLNKAAEAGDGEAQRLIDSLPRKRPVLDAPGRRSTEAAAQRILVEVGAPGAERN